MPTSGRIDFSVNAIQIVTAALRATRSIDTHETIDPVDLANGLEALNMLSKQWQGKPGFKMWARKRSSLTFATSKISYVLNTTVGSDLLVNPPIEILIATLKQGNSEIPMTPMLLEEYQSIGDKTQTGTPTKYYYEPQLDGGHLYLNVKPSSLTDTIELTYLRPIEDFVNDEDTPDYPQEWYRALKFNLALDLCPEKGGPVDKVFLAALAKSSLGEAINFYPETTEQFFEPGRD